MVQIPKMIFSKGVNGYSGIKINAFFKKFHYFMVISHVFLNVLNLNFFGMLVLWIIFCPLQVMFISCHSFSFKCLHRSKIKYLDLIVVQILL